MKNSVLITGTSGMVGRGVLIECLQSDAIESVVIVNRKSIELKHPKLKEIIVPDFMKIQEFKDQLRGLDACFFCAGVSSVGMNEEKYSQLTFELTTHFASVFLEANPNSIFTYVSGQGTDSSEKGKSMWARVKGKTENALFQMAFKKAVMFRPGYIQPMKGVKSKTKLYAFMYMIFWPIYLILKIFPGAATNSVAVGRAMIICLSHETPPIMENKAINEWSKR
jgi:uncharacterized protein YbjT (DUF2867 family)